MGPGFVLHVRVVLALQGTLIYEKVLIMSSHTSQASIAASNRRTAPHMHGMHDMHAQLCPATHPITPCAITSGAHRTARRMSSFDGDKIDSVVF